MNTGDRNRRVRNVSAELSELARRMRENMTPAEQRLWDALRSRRLGGLRFRAQHPVETFIFDFYCPSCKLVIEVDGAVHDERTEHDAERTAHLNRYGYRVLRFRNEEILNDLPSVLEGIARAATPLSGSRLVENEETG